MTLESIHDWVVQENSSTLREFMDRTNNYVNIENTLQALLEPRKQKMKLKTKNPSNSRDSKSLGWGGKKDTSLSKTKGLTHP